MIPVTKHIAVDEAELRESFIRASGPGGQNVNKVATAVQLRFDARASPNLPEAVRARLMKLAGTRLTGDGEIVLTARRHRTQERNRAEAREQLFTLIRRAAIAPIIRRPTKPTKASRQRRLDAKSHRARTKRDRRPDGDD